MKITNIQLINFRNYKNQRQLLKEINPDVIFSTHQRAMNAVPLVNAANINETFEYFFQNLKAYKKNGNLIKNSMDYKIGSFILKPIRFINREKIK